MISTFGGEKVRISLFLGVSGNGYKLPPVLIFKAKKYGRLEKTLNELELVKQKKIYVYCQENTWSDYDNIITNHHAKVDKKIILDWVHDIWYNKIEPKIIINGFKKTGITVNDDGSEDDLVTEACVESDEEDIKEDFSNNEDSEEDEFSEKSD